MPLSRPVLIALAGAILAVAAFFASSAAKQGSGVPEVSPQELQAKVDKQNAARKSKPDAVRSTAQDAAAKAKPAQSAKPADAKPVKPQPEPAVAKVTGVPQPVARALAKKRVVVLFFRQRGSADDRETAAAVNAQRGRKGVSVFSDSIRRLANYRAVVGSLGIAQAPAVVIVGRDGKARVVEGFVDEGSLTQRVVDSR